MRTFHHIELIREIKNDVYGTIGQHSYQNFRVYYDPFRMFAQPVYLKGEKAVEHIPSIEEYTASKFGFKEHLVSAMFDYYYTFGSENQSQLFTSCMSAIEEYEATFPLNEKYELEVKSPWSIEVFFDHIFKRPAMHGINNFSELRAYFDGRFAFKKKYAFDLDEFEIKLAYFIQEWKQKVNPEYPFDTWDRAFRKERMNSTDFNNAFKWELTRFREILTDDYGFEIKPYDAIG